MQDDYRWQQGQCDEHILDVIETAIETVEKMHSLPITLEKIRKVMDATHLTDKKQMWDELQKFYAKYKPFINGLSPVLGYYVYDVDAEFYKKVTIEEIARQLHIVIGYICMHDALIGKIKETFIKTFMNALKRKGFDDDFIKQLKSRFGGINA